MRFCPVCGNYLYLVSDEEAIQLDQQCKHCGYTEVLKPKSTEEALILETTLAKSKSDTQSVLNEYTKLDPTLPRLKTINCPNTACPSRADESLRDILYIKADAKNLAYQYCCTVCNTQWSGGVN